MEQTSQGLASDIGRSPDPVGEFLSSARSFYLSRDYVAMLELSMAARADRRLARIFHSLFRDYRKRHDEIWIGALEQLGYERRSVEKFVDLANCLLRGVALTAAWQLPPSLSRAPFDELQELAPLLLTAPRTTRHTDKKKLRRRRPVRENRDDTL